ncbi:hypothetical protein JK354_12180 [Haloferax volcanii]|uniref:Uncharacterized protein n=1 Tax=Haloferax volcanii TaxID=2246 RepID=A0A8T5CDA7_HALVO|nr:MULTISPECIES: hypothetical protein [Haloferax]MBS8119890.1 hypothetical protein [Haloferax volcanii]MBS8124928.1 hypothetical protein [Haloferax volcanii]MBS8128425.1 hypothetical protein [Haloferax volcanii]MBS8132290.1 hypothetical protein [Haloferax volcanii]MDW7536500.1 hypothetical protein [Haloferax volcanii]
MAVAAAVSGAVIRSGFVALDFVLDAVTVWGYPAAVGVMVVCAVVSWPTDLPGILSSEFGGSGGEPPGADLGNATRLRPTALRSVVVSLLVGRNHRLADVL